MRLWHKDLIRVLPAKQLLSQWRECCSIAKGVKEGTLNHMLVNKVKQYPLEHLYSYGVLIGEEMERRGFSVNPETFLRYFYHYDTVFHRLPTEEVFTGWHNKRYMMQCRFNLQEKYDCGGITDDEWEIIMGYHHSRKETEK